MLEAAYYYVRRRGGQFNRHHHKQSEPQLVLMPCTFIDWEMVVRLIDL